MSKSANIDLNKKFQEAGFFHQRGELKKAQIAYKSILRSYPKHFEALYYLGVTYLQLGEPKLAVDLIEKAAGINPNSPQVFNDLGYAFKATNSPERAIKCYEKAILLNKNFAEAYNNRGIVYIELEQWSEALSDFDQAIALKSNYPEAYTNRGAALKALGRLDDALTSHDKALALNPFFSEAYNNRGLVQKELGQSEKAIGNFLKAIEYRPSYSSAYYNLGRVFSELERYDDALSSFDKAIALKLDYIEAYSNRGRVLQELKRFDEAFKSHLKTIELNPYYAEGFNGCGNALKKQQKHEEALEYFDKAIVLKPHYPEAYNNRGIELHFLNRLEEALASYEKAIEIYPEFAEAYTNRSGVLKDLNRLDDALASSNRSIELRSDYAEGYWSRSHIHLLRGDLKTGLIDHEWRRKSDLGPQCPLPNHMQLTNNTDLDGKILFIYPELYLGDAIQFCRYALLAEERGARVIMATNESLHALLKTMSPTIDFLPKNSIPFQLDYFCPLMSLPYAFDTTLETIPASIPYLKADLDRIARWRSTIGNKGFRIGICWQGSTQPYSVLMRRSFPLSHFQKLSQIQDVRLISLQKSDGTEQLSSLPAGMTVETLGDDFDSGPDAFLDTAAVMENLDLIITTDTAIAHLAGALGRPTWVALKDVPDWRWLLDRSDSPWYPTMTLFRQKRRDNWDDVFNLMEAKLREMLNAKP